MISSSEKPKCGCDNGQAFDQDGEPYPCPCTEDAKCEGCGKPAVTADSDGIPLCRECADACDELAAKKGTR